MIPSGNLLSNFYAHMWYVFGMIGKSRAALSFGVITEYDNEFVVIDEWEDGVLVSREGRYGELNRLGTTFTLSREEYERFCSPVRD